MEFKNVKDLYNYISSIGDSELLSFIRNRNCKSSMEKETLTVNEVNYFLKEVIPLHMYTRVAELRFCIDETDGQKKLAICLIEFENETRFIRMVRFLSDSYYEMKATSNKNERRKIMLFAIEIDYIFSLCFSNNSEFVIISRNSRL
ncbi:MAG: hypothetical protein NZM44_05345 [Candidatus Calescibacterium sp.]|nr:hypothetical protein [Candidatus Calescibacterium sp.]